MTFLKYAGGKSQLLPQITELMPDMKDIKGYVEPFIGGGSVFFNLAKSGYLKNKKVYISDINSDLINTYMMVRDNCMELCDYLKKYEKNHSEKFYYFVRSAYHTNLDNLEKAAAYIYLNKSCYNGMMRMNSDGRYNMGYNQTTKLNLCDLQSFEECNRSLQEVDIRVVSYEKLLDIPNLGKDWFIYCDPPYDDINFGMGSYSFKGYNKDLFEGRVNLRKVLVELNRLEAKFMLSNIPSPMILSEFKEYNIYPVKAKRMICNDGDKRGEINEVIITNYKQLKRQFRLGDF